MNVCRYVRALEFNERFANYSRTFLAILCKVFSVGGEIYVCVCACMFLNESNIKSCAKKAEKPNVLDSVVNYAMSVGLGWQVNEPEKTTNKQANEWVSEWVSQKANRLVCKHTIPPDLILDTRFLCKMQIIHTLKKRNPLEHEQQQHQKSSTLK